MSRCERMWLDLSWSSGQTLVEDVGNCAEVVQAVGPRVEAQCQAQHCNDVHHDATQCL